MAELSTLARPYAKAAFEAGKAENALAKWSEMLATLASVSLDEKVQDVLEDPAQTAATKAAVLADLVGDDLTVEAKNLVATLADNKRLALLPEIAVQYEKLKAEQEKSIEVQVTSAFTLSADQEKVLAEKLKAKMGRDIILVSDVDEKLIGGVVIRTDDMVIDGSVTGKLAKLAEAMYS